ncbi:hypothetical protein ACFL0O_05405 [Thermodesulfobacteriota bacterium]
MTDIYYLPMTRMNLVASIDAFILAPAGFFMRRKYYDDITKIFPNHIIAFSKPTHISKEWMDDDSLLNFPLIVEIKLSNFTGISAVFLDNGSINTCNLKKSSKLKPDTLILMKHPLAISRIEAVWTPGDKTRKALINDPVVKNYNLKFPVNTFTDEPEFSSILDLLSREGVAGIKIPKGTDIKRLDCLFSVAGGAAALGKATWQEIWTPGHSFSTHVLSCIDSIISETDYLKVKRTPFQGIRNFKNLDGFKKNIPVDIRSIAYLGELSIRNIFENHALKIMSENIPEIERDVISSQGYLVKADQLAMSVLLRECISVLPDELSPGEIIFRTIEQLYSFGASNFEINDQLKRICKGMEIVINVIDGVESVETLFSRSTLWARSIRAAAIFSLRSEIPEILNWPFGERPGKADIEDYFRGVFLAGLYTGFTRLPSSVKKDWSAVIEVPVNRIPVRGSKKNKPTETGRWEIANGVLKGKFSLIYPDDNTISVKSSFKISSIIQHFIDEVYPRLKNGVETYKEKRVLGLIANQTNLLECQIADITIEIDEETKNQIDEARRLDTKKIKLSIPQTKLKFAKRWNYEGIANALSEFDIKEIPEEILALICNYLDYNYHPLKKEVTDDLKDIKNLGILKLVDFFLNDIQKQSAISDDQPISLIYDEGIKLARQLTSLLQADGILSLKQQKEIRSALLYLVLPSDIISEETDPKLGMIDDWILLANTAKSLISGKGLKKNALTTPPIPDVIKRAEYLLELIGNEFGTQFVETIFHKICLIKTE